MSKLNTHFRSFFSTHVKPYSSQLCKISPHKSHIISNTHKHTPDTNFPQANPFIITFFLFKAQGQGMLTLSNLLWFMNPYITRFKTPNQNLNDHHIIRTIKQSNPHSAADQCQWGHNLLLSFISFSGIVHGTSATTAVLT